MKIERGTLHNTINKMKSQGYDYLVKITAVDYIDHVDVIYVIRNMMGRKQEILELTLNPSDLWVPTIIEIHGSADWYEREMSEMFGITIKGRNAPRLLLEKWDGIDPPLRKSFQWNAAYRTRDTEKK